MIADTTSSGPTGPREQQIVDRWLFRDRDSVEQRFGLEMDRILELRKSKEGQRELIQRMKKADPSLNGNVNDVLRQVDRNLDQLNKKESFLGKVVKLPLRAVQAVGRTIKKHPVLSAVAGIAAIIALLYFTPALAPTAGEYGKKLIDAFKSVLGKLNVPTPETAVDAVAQVPVTGGSVSEAVAEAATEAANSPSAMESAGRLLKEAARESGLEGAASQLSPAAEEALRSGTAGAGAAAKELMMPEVVDPLQRALRALPPLD